MLIVGGGPAGLFLAARLAAQGVRTLVCEEHQTVGDPVHCTGVLSADSFPQFNLPTDATLNTLTTARFVSPGGIAVEYSTPTPLAIVIDRPVFDRALAFRAVAAGAEVRSGTRVATIDIGPSGVRAIAGRDMIEARLAVLACGASYAFQRRFGLGLPRTYLHSAQRELPVTRTASLEMHFGQDAAPSGFAWSVPVSRPDGPHVRVGVMTSSDAVGFYRRMVDRVADRWGVRGGDLPPRQKILPLGAIERTYGDRLLAVGDAAGLRRGTRAPQSSLVQLQGQPRDIDAGGSLQALDVPREHLAQRNKLRAIGTRETRIGRLQGSQGRVHAACELQLLHRDGEDLLYLGQHPLVAAARQFLVERLERHLLVLGFDQLRLELDELGLGLAHGLLRLARRRAGITTVGVAVAQPPGPFFAQSGYLQAPVIPLPRDHRGHDDERNDYRMGEPAQPRPDAAKPGICQRTLFFHGGAASASAFRIISHFSKKRGERFCQGFVARTGDDDALDA